MAELARDLPILSLILVYDVILILRGKLARKCVAQNSDALASADLVDFQACDFSGISGNPRVPWVILEIDVIPLRNPNGGMCGDGECRGR